MNNLSDTFMSTLTYYLTETRAPAAVPVDIVDYSGKGYAYRIYHDDLQDLPDSKKEDFAQWIIDQAKKAEVIIGLPVTAEVSTYE